ncbi:MAG: hypothetical protein KAU16_04770 [Methanophagales archaeon]|nr:hypothetical protein [Methanophagales archaeon]
MKKKSKNELRKRQKVTLKAIGLLGFLLFSGILGFIYFYLTGDVELNQISGTWILFLIVVIIFWALPPVREKLYQLSQRDDKYNRFFYRHPILTMAIFVLIGMLVGFLLLSLGIWK